MASLGDCADATIGAYLALRRSAPEEAASRLLRLARVGAARAVRASRLPADLADDFAMECCVVAERADAAALRRARPTVSLAAWLHGTSRNLALQEIRRRSRARGAPRLSDREVGRTAR